MLSLGSMETDSVISDPCYNGAIYNIYSKITICLFSFYIAKIYLSDKNIDSPINSLSHN